MVKRKISDVHGNDSNFCKKIRSFNGSLDFLSSEKLMEKLVELDDSDSDSDNVNFNDSDSVNFSDNFNFNDSDSDSFVKDIESIRCPLPDITIEKLHQFFMIVNIDSFMKKKLMLSDAIKRCDTCKFVKVLNELKEHPFPISSIEEKDAKIALMMNIYESYSLDQLQDIFDNQFYIDMLFERHISVDDAIYPDVVLQCFIFGDNEKFNVITGACKIYLEQQDSKNKFLEILELFL